jgi:hypothetical protein
MTALRQIPEDEVKSSLRAVAVLRTTLDELARAAGIHPETHNGNLGNQREAFLEADDGSQYMLVESLEGPTHDVELRAEERIADPQTAINRFVKSLALTPELIVWRVNDEDWAPNRELPAPPQSQRSANDGPPRTLPQSTGTARAMDVLVLIDELDDLVHKAKPVPLTDQVRLDKEEIYSILDQMRATIPEEIKQARWIVKERQEMLAEAKREAGRIVQEARDRQEGLTSQEEITRQAERAAEDAIEEARANEREIRLGAEDYADGILNTLEVNLSKFIAAVRRGREHLVGTEEPGVLAGPTGRGSVSEVPSERPTASSR